MTKDTTKSEETANQKAVSEIQAAEKKAPTAMLTEGITRKLAYLGGLLLVIILVVSALYLLASENDTFNDDGSRIRLESTAPLSQNN